MNESNLKYKHTCIECGICCTAHNETASTYLYIPDIEDISSFLNISKTNFLEKFTEIYSYKYFEGNVLFNESFRIVLKSNNSCIFLNELNKCKINPVKPFICKYGPFIPEIIESKKELENWMLYCNGFTSEKLKTEEYINRQREYKDVKKQSEFLEKEYFKVINANHENEFTCFISKSNISKTINLKLEL